MGDLIDYDFELLNPSDFELRFDMRTDKKRMNWLFDKALAKMTKQEVVDPNQIDKISEFKVSPTFFKYIKTVTRKNCRKVFKEVKADGIIILQYHVDSGVFKKGKGEDWNIHIVYRGTHMDKRKSEG